MVSDEDVIELDVSDLIEDLQGYEDRLKNLPLDLYGMMMISKVDEMFQSEGASGTDGPWEPLSPSTIKRHPRRAGGMLLQDTGAMAASNFTSERGFDLTLYNTSGQSRWHLGGTEHMPKRDFFAINFAELLDEMGENAIQELQ